MGEEARIKSLLKQIIGDDMYQVVIPCTIVSVSGNICEVSPINGEANITGVRLSSEDDTTNILITPSVGSVVMVGMLNDAEGIVIMFGKVSSVKIRGDQYGGLVEVAQLISKINALESKVNTIIAAYNTLVLPVSGATAGPPAVPIAPPLTPTVRSDIENTAVTHG